MNSKIISLNPKPPADLPEKPSTNPEATPKYPDKASFPTIDRKDALPVKRKVAPQLENDDRITEPTPKYNRSEPTDTRRTQRGYGVHTSRSQPHEEL